MERGKARADADVSRLAGIERERAVRRKPEALSTERRGLADRLVVVKPW